MRQKEEALLAENNKELYQQRLLDQADHAKKDSIEVFAHERQMANSEIQRLTVQVSKEISCFKR